MKQLLVKHLSNDIYGSSKWYPMMKYLLINEVHRNISLSIICHNTERHVYFVIIFLQTFDQLRHIAITNCPFMLTFWWVLDVGIFCDKSTETTLHEMCVQVFLRLSDSGKSSQSVSFIYEFALPAGIRKSEKKNLLKTSCKFATVTKVANILWWRHGNRTQSASVRYMQHWCDISCDSSSRTTVSILVNVNKIRYNHTFGSNTTLWNIALYALRK